MTIEQDLNTPTLVAVRDVHTEDLARSLVQSLINRHLVKTFFIEWNCEDGELNNYLWTAADSRKPIRRDDLSAYFGDIAKADAKPDLIDLTILAINKGAHVVAMDHNPQKALQEIKTRLAYPSVMPALLFQDSGLKVRDEFAGREIAKFLIEGPRATGRLMMWGANHFDELQERWEQAPFKLGLAQIIRDYHHPRLTRIPAIDVNVYDPIEGPDGLLTDY